MKKAIIIGVAAIVIGILFIVRLYSVDLQVRKPTQQEQGKMVNFCTVKKIKFQITKETPVIDYKGKTYYFCCTHCLGSFKGIPINTQNNYHILILKEMQINLDKKLS